jgi:hypothetical protein
MAKNEKKSTESYLEEKIPTVLGYYVFNDKLIYIIFLEYGVTKLDEYLVAQLIDEGVEALSEEEDLKNETIVSKAFQDYCMAYIDDPEHDFRQDPKFKELDLDEIVVNSYLDDLIEELDHNSSLMVDLD